jgi:hypothetical protein
MIAMKNKVKLEDIIRRSPDAISLAQAIQLARLDFRSGVFEGYCRYIRVVGLGLGGPFPEYESEWSLIATGAAAFHESDIERRIKAYLKEHPTPGYFLEQVEAKITRSDGEDIWLQSDVL